MIEQRRLTVPFVKSVLELSDLIVSTRSKPQKESTHEHAQRV
jgi:hypothetical protein